MGPTYMYFSKAKEEPKMTHRVTNTDYATLGLFPNLYTAVLFANAYTKGHGLATYIEEV